ncbi:hypothetical protein HZH68_014382 [Vespula germanica]|uniref:Uncharacterized protein n=1 Tax=Vespula germanica TaxID=30212 RepID=A0A834MUC5_VESGE|nr:hypothetical protein HZH68_014382 [Vespula germanica]
MKNTKRTLENKDGNPFKDYQIGVPQRVGLGESQIRTFYLLCLIRGARAKDISRLDRPRRSIRYSNVLCRSSETTQKTVRGASFRFVFSRREVGEGGGGKGGGASRRKQRASCKTRKDTDEDRVVSDWTDEFRR